MEKQGKLELTWVGKYEEEKLEPRIFIEDEQYSYGDTSEGNMLIHGDNLIALEALQQEYTDKIKCIYIDPPYNTGSAFEHYDDGVEHSIWLSLMRKRLILLRNLLSDDGFIFVQIDNNEMAYLKILMDEIFGRNNFVNDIVWKRKGGSVNPKNRLNNNTDYILWYAKSDKATVYPVYTLEDEETQEYIKKRFTHTDENGRKFRLSPIISPTYSPKDENAFKAFTFMNQSMYLQRSITAYSKDCGRGIPCSLSDYMKDNKEKGIEQDHSEWRPFQIAFILLNIKGLIDPESDERNIVDLLYFPTGGGKTEAYLGLIAFIIAYRRLTSDTDSDYEKHGGVTVFLRYTLRLLTTQQRDRLLKLIVAMEDLRERSEKNGKAEFGTTPISIGYWVGGGVTPNKFDEYEKDEYSRKEFIRKVTKQIIRCPYCGKLIGRENYDINTKTNSLKITCSYDKCKFSKSSGKSIPVYLVDEEIYAKCPTVVISTVDKFAKLPWSEQTGLLFGRTDRCCPRHGYQAIGYGKELVGKRHNKDAKNGLDACVIEACKPFYPPQLIIQDELHLISGPLGTIYGGYETIIEDMCCLEKNGKKIHPKYVVSTATIKNAGEQIKCLYARENYAQFPPSGFDTRDSYFIREIPLVSKDLEDLTEDDITELLEKGEKPFRQYAGICASGQSVKTTLIRLYSVLLQEVFILSEDPKYQDYVDPYYTLVGYFNSIRELGGAVRLLDDDINSRLKVLRKKYKNARQRFLGFDGKKEITSRIPSYQIAEILEKLAEPFDPSKERQSCYDVVIATNMIAVGMDVDRLGLMAVVGQPKQNSEYIQATSRVGRKYPGIIFTVYNPYRPRDLSNYENFVGFHSQMYRYVEGTTATPFAARARDRVLHALVVAMLRLQTETMAGNKGASNILSISDEELRKIKDQILERVSIVAPMAYESASDDIDAFISTWKEIAKDKNLYYFVANTENNKRLLSFYGQPVTGKEKPTLNSMRDVEQSSTVYLYEEGGAL